MAQNQANRGVPIKTYVPEDQHRKLKAILASKGKTIKNWLLEMVEREIKDYEA
jgi:hypothetical protein